MGKYGPVIDSDGHVIETHIDWESYIEPAYKQDAPRLLVDAAGYPRLYMEGRVRPKHAGWGRAVGPPFAKLKVGPEGMRDPKVRLEHMAVEGIDVAVLFGTIIALGGAGIEDPGYGAAVCRAYNNWLYDYCSENSDRLKGIAVVPLQDVSAAIVELRRSVTELGMVGVCSPAHVQGKNCDHVDFLPFYAECERLGVPVCFHTAPGHPGVMAAGIERSNNFFVTHAIAFPVELMIASASLIAAGIPERFPRLKFGFFEAGISWVPYWIERLDEHYEKLAGHVPALTKAPSEIMRGEQFFYSCEPEEHRLPEAIEDVGADRIMYASDYAHWDCEYPNSVREIAEREEVPAEIRRKLLFDNAARFFSFDGAATEKLILALGATR